MNYVEGFVLPVPAEKREAYREMAAKAALVFKEYGALRVVECWGDDVPAGKVTDFQRSVLAEPGERVVFSWVVWPSKAAREENSPKVMNDPRMKAPSQEIFDAKRMIYGGFDVIVDV